MGSQFWHEYCHILVCLSIPKILQHNKISSHFCDTQPIWAESQRVHDQQCVWKFGFTDEIEQRRWERAEEIKSDFWRKKKSLTRYFVYEKINQLLTQSLQCKWDILDNGFKYRIYPACSDFTRYWALVNETQKLSTYFYLMMYRN